MSSWNSAALSHQCDLVRKRGLHIIQRVVETCQSQSAPAANGGSSKKGSKKKQQHEEDPPFMVRQVEDVHKGLGTDRPVFYPVLL